MGILATVPEKTREMVALVDQYKAHILDVLPDPKKLPRVIRNIRSTLVKKPQLAKCDGLSLLSSILESCALGLELHTALGHAYIVPFKGRAVLVIGYLGYVELAYRSGQICSITNRIHYANDQFLMRYGTDPQIDHAPNMTNRGVPVGAYCTAHIRDGDTVFTYMNAEEILAHKKMSAAGQSADSPWNHESWEVKKTMWLKTTIRTMQKLLPKSIDMMTADALDQQADMGQRQSLRLMDAIVGPEEEEAPQQAEALKGRTSAARNRTKPQQTPPPTEAPAEAPADPPDAPIEPVPFSEIEKTCIHLGMLFSTSTTSRCSPARGVRPSSPFGAVCPRGWSTT